MYEYTHTSSLSVSDDTRRTYAIVYVVEWVSVDWRAKIAPTGGSWTEKFEYNNIIMT